MGTNSPLYRCFRGTRNILLTGSRTQRRVDRQEKSTLISDRGRIARHIIPLLVRKSVTSVTRNDVEDFMHDVAAGKTAGREKTKPHGLSIARGGRGVAGRTVALLGAIFTYAVRQGHRIDNPIHGVVKFAVGRRQRRLTDDEYPEVLSSIAPGRSGWSDIRRPMIRPLPEDQRNAVRGV